MQIGFVFHQPTSDYWSVIVNAARERATQHGVELLIEPTSTVAQQVAVIGRLAARAVSGVIIGPHAHVGLGEAIRAAQLKGIVVVTTESLLLDCTPDAAVLSQNRIGGTLVAQQLIGQLGGQGRVVHVVGPQLVESGFERAEGIRAALAANPGITVSAEVPSGGWLREDGARCGAAICAAHPDLDAVIAPNDLVAAGVLDAFAAAGRPAPLVSGYDGSPEGLLAIHSGQLVASVKQNLHELGAAAVDLAVRRIRGEAIPARWLTAVQLVTRENLLETALEVIQTVPKLVNNAVQLNIALEHEQARLLTLIDHLPDTYIFIKDRERRYELANRAYLDLMGIPNRETLIGKRDHDFLSADQSERYAREDAAIVASGAPLLDRVEQFTAPSGAVSWSITSKVPLQDNDGAVIGLLGVVRNITDLKVREQERAQVAQQLIDAQATALREVGTPIIPIGERVVIVPLIGAIDDRRAAQLLETLLAGVARHAAEQVILDITGVPLVDTRIANALVNAAQAVKLLGAAVVLTGIRAEVAQTLVGLGADLEGIQVRGTLQSAVAAALGRRSPA